jgi:hypothetical protein
MEPLPETVAAVQRLAEYGDTEIAVELFRIGREVQEVVPEIVGVSLGLPADGFTFTLVASSDEVRQLDSTQYLDDGPCVEALHSGDTIETEMAQLLDEDRWLMFARASAAYGVESTLSLPVVRKGRVIACVNLYAWTRDAFVGHHEELAAICRGWAPGAIANADLAFRTRLEAVATPQRMQEQDVVDQAIGMLAATLEMAVADAAERLRQAAVRAGITEPQAAKTIIRLLSNT